MKIWKIASIEDYSPDKNLNQIIYFIRASEKNVTPPDWYKYNGQTYENPVNLWSIDYFFSDHGYAQTDGFWMPIEVSESEVISKAEDLLRERCGSPSASIKRVADYDQFNEFSNLILDASFVGPFYVSLYERSRAYGGPHEGGWWYDTHKFIRALKGPIQYYTEALNLQNSFREKFEENLHDYSIYENLPENAPPGIEEGRYPEGYIPTGFSTPENYVVLIELQPGNLDTSNNPPPSYE